MYSIQVTSGGSEGAKVKKREFALCGNCNGEKESRRSLQKEDHGVEQGRKRYLDLLKIGGSLCIVALHTLSNTLNAGGYFSDFHVRVVLVLHQLFYTSVPVFLLCTGAGFLASGRDNSFAGMKRNIIKVLACILLFGSLFWASEQLVIGNSLRFRDLVLALLGDATWSHMWYLYRLLGVYLCIPLISGFVRHASSKDHAIACGVLLFFSVVYPLIAGYIGFYAAEIMPVSGVWLFYVIAGGILGKMSLETLRKFQWPALLGIIVTGCVIVWTTVCRGTGYVFTESDPVTLLLAVCLFVEARCLCRERASLPWQAALSANALGCYVIHPVFIHICVKGLHFNPQHHLPLLTIPLTVSVIFGLSMAMVWLLRRITFVRKYLL